MSIDMTDDEFKTRSKELEIILNQGLTHNGLLGIQEEVQAVFKEAVRRLKLLSSENGSGDGEKKRGNESLN